MVDPAPSSEDAAPILERVEAGRVEVSELGMFDASEFGLLSGITAEFDCTACIECE